MLADEQMNNYRTQIAELDELVTTLKKENTNLKVNQEKSQHMQSAFQSNNRAYSDKFLEM